MTVLTPKHVSGLKSRSCIFIARSDQAELALTEYHAEKNQAQPVSPWQKYLLPCTWLLMAVTVPMLLLTLYQSYKSHYLMQGLQSSYDTLEKSMRKTEATYDELIGQLEESREAYAALERQHTPAGGQCAAVARHLQFTAFWSRCYRPVVTCPVCPVCSVKGASEKESGATSCIEVL